MRVLIQKPQIDVLNSFACREYTTPQFESAWHKHDEYELILITRGNGTLLLGDYTGPYEVDEVYFIASNLPHSFRKAQPDMIGSAIVIHFHAYIFGDTFLNMPELKGIHALLGKQEGIRLENDLGRYVSALLRGIEQQKGYYRINTLLLCLESITNSDDFTTLASRQTNKTEKIDPTIETIFEFSFAHYLTNVTLAQVAAQVNMTTTTFCRFFKKNVKKTYFDFLQELRIGHACKLLSETELPVLDICFQSGFNSWSHFSKKFRQLKQTSPLKYRNEFRKT
jgi:AraC-like DNA-binding protein